DIISIEAIEDVRPDRPEGWRMYFIASPDNPTQRYLYQFDSDAKKLSRITPDSQPGTHAYNISPNHPWAIHTYSTFTNPPVIDLIPLPSHITFRVLEDNSKLRERVAKLRRPMTEFFRINIATNLALDAWAILPPDFNPGGQYPVVFHVYGEPAGQTVLDAWPR